MNRTLTTMIGSSEKLLRSLAVVFMFLFALPLFAQTGGVAVIDPQKIVENSALGKKLFAEIKILKDKKQAEIDVKQNSIKAMRDKLAKETTESAEAQKLKSDIERAVTDLSRFAEDSDREVKAGIEKAIKQIEDKVLPIVKILGDEKDYAVVLQMDQLVYFNAQNKTDITDEVIRRFDAAYAKGAATPK